MSTNTQPAFPQAIFPITTDRGMTALVDAAHDLAAPSDVPSLLAILARQGRRLLSTAVAFVAVTDEDDPERAMTVRAVDGFTCGLARGLRIPAGDRVAAAALEGPGPHWIPDVHSSPETVHSEPLADLVRTEGLRTLIAARIGNGSGRFGHSPFGVLYLADRRVRSFAAGESALLASLAELAGASIEKVRLLDLTVARLCGLENTTARTAADLSAVRALRTTHFDFIELAVGGGAPQQLVDEAGRLLRGAATLYAADGTMVATSRAGAPPAAGEPAIAAVGADRILVPVGEHTWAMAVLAGNLRLGTLVLHIDDHLDDQDRELLPLIGQAAAVLLRNGNGNGSEHVLHNLLDDVLATQGGRGTRRGRRTTLDLDLPHHVVMLLPEGVTTEAAARWAAAEAQRRGGLGGLYDDTAVLVLPGRGDAAELARALSGQAGATLGCAVTVAAAGPGSGPDAVAGNYTEAKRCLHAMRMLNLTGQGASAGQLGFLAVLLAGRDGVDNFIESVLGPVREYDRRRMTGLLRTMDAYFAAGGSPSGAAERLHVHPNTVARRLDRVRELLGTDWQAPARALEIQLALRIGDLLGAW
jgi:hypothetical protein